MTTVDRATKYVDAMPPAISGSGGHNATFAVAIALRHGFDLSEDEAWPILLDYNKRCAPPWTEKELRHKLASANRLQRHPQPRGYLRGSASTKPAIPAQSMKPLRLRVVGWKERVAEVREKPELHSTPATAPLDRQGLIAAVSRLFNAELLPDDSR